MSVGVCMILVQNLTLMMTCSILMFCAAKKVKKGGGGDTTGATKTGKTGATTTGGSTASTTGDTASTTGTDGATGTVGAIGAEGEKGVDELVKPPPAEPLEPPRPAAKPLEGNGLVDEDGYILDPKYNDDLATLKYLETYKPPQVEQYPEDQVNELMNREIDKSSPIDTSIMEMRQAWIQRMKDLAKANKDREEKQALLKAKAGKKE